MASKTRSIFEVVSDIQKPLAAPGGIDAGGKCAREAIRACPTTLSTLALVMLIVGGLPRPLDTGLSLT